VTPSGGEEDARPQANASADGTPAEDLEARTPEEIGRLLHELHAQLSELQMQNAELRRGQADAEQLRRVLDSSRDMIFAIDQDYYLAIFNRAYQDALHAAGGRAMAIGETVLSPEYPPTFLDQWRGYYDRALAGESFTVETRLIWRDGEHALENMLSPLYDPEGNITGVLVVTRDITVHRRTEEALQVYSSRLEELVAARNRDLQEAADRLLHQERLVLLGQLAAGVGHELRNPLGAILNTAYYLRLVLSRDASWASTSEISEALQILEKEVRAADRVITSLLDFAHGEAPRRTPTDLNAVVKRIVSAVIVPANVEIIYNLDPALPLVMADAEQLALIFGNLVDNALQAMPSGGHLSIASRRIDAYRVAAAITDTGVGIPLADRARVFEPLFTTKAKGIGLGLSLSNTMVEAHGGTIEIFSEPGTGTTISVNLPVDWRMDVDGMTQEQKLR
jgi:PAS domain S-box-containing protein